MDSSQKFDVEILSSTESKKVVFATWSVGLSVLAAFLHALN